MGFALCVCLVTSFWCILFVRRKPKGYDRFLATLIGAVSLCQGFRILRQAGILSNPGSFFVDQFADLMVTGLYLIAMAMLRFSAIQRKRTEVKLRLVEANDGTPATRLADLDTPSQSISSIILDSNPLAAIAMDRAGNVTYWNPAAERLFGWSSKEVVGKKSPVPASGPTRTKAGLLVRGELWVSPLRDSAGRSHGTVLMMAPIDKEPGIEIKPSLVISRFAPVASA